MNYFKTYYMLSRVYFFTTLFFAMMAILSPVMVLFIVRQEKQIIIMDNAGNYHQVLSKPFSAATKLHVECAAAATRALLNRTAAGIDDNFLLKQVYLKNCTDDIKNLVESESKDFEIKNIHQRVEISEVRFVRQNQFYIATVTGQLTRACEYLRQKFVEVKKFRLVLQMVENPNISANGYLPLNVLKIRHYKIEDIKK